MSSTITNNNADPTLVEEPLDKVEATPCPNVSDDPETLSKDSSKEETHEKFKEVMIYTKDMYETYVNICLREEQLWPDFKAVFRTQTLHIWKRGTVTKWTELLKMVDK